MRYPPRDQAYLPSSTMPRSHIILSNEDEPNTSKKSDKNNKKTGKSDKTIEKDGKSKEKSDTKGNKKEKGSKGKK